MKKSISIMSLMLCFAALTFTACVGDGDDTIVIEDGNNTGIPSDELAGKNPDVEATNTAIPNIQYTIEKDGRDAIMRIDMTGIQDAYTHEWLYLLGTAQKGQNVWLSVDDKPKGILVYNNSDKEEAKVAADLVFLVDNSGSMSEEADGVARDISSWAQELENSNLDIKFGCVGYSVNGRINGGLNMTDAVNLKTFLGRSTGTSRTVGFEGSDASALSSAASSYRVDDECGGMALRYADANMSFRTGANRIYVNFTDEPNQPAGNKAYSTEFFKDQTNWSTAQGTVHTVYSEDTTYFRESILYNEKPWRISQYTGGTILQVRSDFSGVTLSSLPVTGAMQHSYIIRFTNIAEFMDGRQHKVRITVLSSDKKTQAERVFYVTFG